MPQFMRRSGRAFHGRKIEFVRRQLPYGLYHCADGREVLFDRDYCPIVSRRPGEAAVLADSSEQIAFTGQKWFYDDGTPERTKLKAATDKLREWGFEPSAIGA